MFATEIYIDRRNQLLRQFSEGLILLLGNGESPINAFDNCYRFRQDSSFLYFCGLDRPGLALLLDVEAGCVTLFGREQTEQDVLWSGLQPSLREQAERSGIRDVASIDTLRGSVRKALAAGRAVHCLPSCRAENTSCGWQSCWTGLYPARGSGLRAPDPGGCRPALGQGAGGDRELDAAAHLGRQLHAAALHMARPGVYEWQVAGELEAVAARAGRALAFPPIVTTYGEILHNHRAAINCEPGTCCSWIAGSKATGIMPPTTPGRCRLAASSRPGSVTSTRPF